MRIASLVLAAACLLQQTTFTAKGVTWFQVLDALELIPSPDAFKPPEAGKPLMQDMTCQQSIDELLLKMVNFDFGAIFYVLLNGWYLGAWGDYAACISDATYGQYVLVTMTGDYDPSNPIFTRGAFGKYNKFQTNVGMCVPTQCSETDMLSMTPHYTAMAEGANWTNVAVSYRFASRDNVDIADSGSGPGFVILLIALIVLISLGAIGTLIELTRIGDLDDLDYKRLDPAAKFVTIRQYQPILLQRKKPWAQFALVFSLLRNFMTIAYQPRAY